MPRNAQRIRDKKTERAAEEARRAKWLADETARIAGQRRAFLNLPRVPSRDALQQAMLDRAWALLDAGKAEEADAILEFLPESAAVDLINEFFDDEASQ